jgi:hypothetical protein
MPPNGGFLIGVYLQKRRVKYKYINVTVIMRNSESQRQRTQDNPLVLGPFSQLSVRKLTGALGPQNKVVGRADTNSNSNGGYGQGTYNHWFRIDIESPAWIIIAKGGTRPAYINVSTFDLNLTPIQGRAIFDQDSVPEFINGEIYFPYVGHVMNKQSNLYNQFFANRLDKGDERYYPLERGSYLLCVSTTRNEPLNYEVSFVVEFPVTTFDILLEDYSLLLYENIDESYVIADTTSDYVQNDLHTHSLSEWDQAWQREHQQGLPFPEALVPLATQP